MEKEMEKMKTKKHHMYSPSKWNAWHICPRFDDNGKDSPEAARGTACHARLSDLITGGGDEPLPNEWDEGSALWAAQAVRGIAGNDIVHSEEPICILSNNPQLHMIRGTADVVIRRIADDGADIRRLVIIDYKSQARDTGEGIVKYIPQLCGYALGAASSEAFPRCMPRLEVEMYILRGGDRTIGVERMELQECERLAEQIIDSRYGVELFGEDNRKRCSWCKYCAHAATCPQAAEALTTVSNAVATNADALMAMPIGARLDAIKQIEEYIKAAKAATKEEVKAAGGRIDCEDGGAYVIQSANGPSKLKPDMMNELATAFVAEGVKVEDLTAACSIGKPAAIKLLKAAGLKAKEAEEIVAPFFDNSTIEKLVKIK